MSITIDSAEAYVFAQLQKLDSTTGDGTAKLVGRYAGELTAEGADSEMLARSPAILLAVEGEEPISASTQDTLLGDAIDCGSLVFRVYAITRDQRGTTKAVKGGTGTLGVLALVEAVIAKLNRLQIATALHTGQVRYMGFRPALIRAGVVYAYMIRFALARQVPGTDDEAITVDESDLERIDTDINVDPETDDSTNPVLQTRSTL